MPARGLWSKNTSRDRSHQWRLPVSGGAPLPPYWDFSDCYSKHLPVRGGSIGSSLSLDQKPFRCAEAKMPECGLWIKNTSGAVWNWDLNLNLLW